MKFRNRGFIHSILVTMVLCIMFDSMAVMGQTIPPELGTLADQALSHACNSKEVPQFDAAMADLGKRVNAKTYNQLLPLEGENLQAKVIVIAYYRAQHDDLYENIMEAYFNITEAVDKLDIHGGPRSPEIQSPYSAEEYRLIWEYYVLSYGRKADKQYSSPCKAGAPWRTIEALGVIGNEKSLILLDFAYQKIIADQSNGFPAGTLGTIIESIFNIGSVSSNQANPALKVFLDCLANSESSADKFLSSGYRKTPDDFFVGFFNFGLSKEGLAKWQAAAASYPRNNLTPLQKSFLQKLLALKPKTK